MKKLTKILPLVMALTLVCPAFADVATSQQSDMSFEVPKYFNINESGETTTATATITGDYANINLDAAMGVTYEIITNNPQEQVKFTATALAGDVQVPALAAYNDGSTDILKVVFTNVATAGGTKATTSDVTNALAASPTAGSNNNAFALALTPSFKLRTDTGVAEAVPTLENGVITYQLTNGIYDVSYTFGQTALPGTFSTCDTYGLYKATISMSQVTP